MSELPWASPEAIGRLTITQMLAIGHAKPPGGPKLLASMDDMQDFLAKLDAEERERDRAWTAANSRW